MPLEVTAEIADLRLDSDTKEYHCWGRYPWVSTLWEGGGNHTALIPAEERAEAMDEILV